ncbi:MAG TPA: fumarylacetoacetate hydrolase family protein [Candidatus Accumulibacter phosphatis]|nr:fumarylacetoacetate hydrolase family protein [Candidatus Accumulibacter phosphatis]
MCRWRGQAVHDPADGSDCRQRVAAAAQRAAPGNRGRRGCPAGNGGCAAAAGGGVLPPWTTNVHHEVEIVVVLGESGIAGYGIGLDLTARDVQARAKQKGEPWAVAKGWLGSAPVSHVVPAEEVVTQNLTFSLDVNGERRQTGTTANMERTIPELLAYLKTVFGLRAGDAIFTGTPEGVAQLHAGDIAVAQLDGYTSLSVSFV